VDAATGKTTTLVGNQPDATDLKLFGWAKLTADGQLLYFYAEGPATALSNQAFPHTLYHSDPDGITNRTAISDAPFYFFDEAQYKTNGSGAFGDVLWSTDGHFAVIVAARQAGAAQGFWLLRADGTPAVKLAESSGTYLHWGLLAP
jgi:hypothetical protein